MPDGPHEVIPGESITLSCEAESFVNSTLLWERYNLYKSANIFFLNLPSSRKIYYKQEILVYFSDNLRMVHETLSDIKWDRMNKKHVHSVARFSHISSDTFVTCVSRSIAGESRKKVEILVAGMKTLIIVY